jgi:hypothetical protein
MANPYGKTRKRNEPYATYYDSRIGWTWKVLKTYQNPDNGSKNPLAIAFCEVDSPLCQGFPDLGDTYLKDISGTLIQGTDILKEYGFR